MGSFKGHVLPGSFLIVFAVWWAVRTYTAFFRCRQRRAKFTASLTSACTCPCGAKGQWPGEAVVKLVFVVVGVSLEIYTAFRGGQFVFIGNAQHATMFVFFGLLGLVELLVFFKAPLPKDSEYVAGVLAFGVEWLIFSFHVAGRPRLDVAVHTLLIYVVGGCVLALLLELRYRNNVLVPLARCYGVLLQGTWFWQIAFILYNPLPGAARWKEDDHEDVTLAVIVFAWHAGLCFLFMLLLGAAVARCYRRPLEVATPDREEEITLEKLLSGKRNAPMVRLLDDDSDLEALAAH